MLDNILALFGMPRSGTTIISRIIANHTRVQHIIEPYQTRRDDGYSQTDVGALCNDFNLSDVEGKSLLIKETMTRAQNIALLRELLYRASDAGYRGAYVFVLRSPLECFISQVEATETLWARKTGFGWTERSIRMFWKSFQESMAHYLEFAFRFHRRFVVYDRFVDNPATEITRAMGLLGYPMEKSQLDLSVPVPEFGGDPKARMAFSDVVASGDHFRTDSVGRLHEEFSSVREFEQLHAMHEYVKRAALEEPRSQDIIRDLALLVGRGYL